MDEISANRGEWSELYTLLKLLADGKLYAADEELERLEEIYYPIIKIFCPDERNSNIEYHINSRVKVVDGTTGNILDEISLNDLIEAATLLLEKIKNSDGSFSVPELSGMLNRLKAIRFRGGAGRKEDIRMVLHDINTGTQPIVGFSIKSRLGQASTLLNASRATNVIYEIKKQNGRALGSRGEGQTLRAFLSEAIIDGFSFEYAGMESETFLENLRMIDSQFPKVISHILLNFYSGIGSNLLPLALHELIMDNPLDLSKPKIWYTYKIKNFLVNVALGMVPASLWEGKFDANGGYIVVKEDGDVLCYHIYNFNEFENYLLNNTKFESPSTQRHQYGKVEDIDGKQYIRLNLQIRFLS